MELKYIDNMSANSIFNEFKSMSGINNASYEFSGTNLLIYWNEKDVNYYLVMALGESITIHDDYFYVHGSKLEFLLKD